jgi:signal transduction histidine kinase
MESSRNQCSENPGDLLCSVFVHEVANSLQIISAAVSLMERDFCKACCGDNTGVESVRLVMKEIDRLSLLLSDFRSSRSFSLDLKPTSLTSVIEDCLALEFSQATQRHIRIQCNLPLGLPLIMADAAKLKQVFLNLYKNAFEAMHDGGILTVSAMERQQTVCVDIRDSGEGIPEGMQIFEPFVTDKPDGTGLGLAVVKWIILAHGGTISYTSKPGEETVFHLSFPIVNNHLKRAPL